VQGEYASSGSAATSYKLAMSYTWDPTSDLGTRVYVNGDLQAEINA